MKQIGTLSNSACSKLWSYSMLSSSANLILAELSLILKIESFKDKAKAKSITSRDSIYISIREERYVATVSDEENPDNHYQFSSSPQEISSLKLTEIKAFQQFEDK